MTTARREYLSDTFRDLVAEGRSIEAMRLLNAVLDKRGFAVPDDIRSRIDSCTDLDQLEEWTLRAMTASSIVELFE
ncbi:hypothetical protein [Nocardia sp. IFM 10818]